MSLKTLFFISGFMCSSLLASVFTTGSISYRHLSGSQYQIYTKIIRDCRAIPLSGSNPGTFKISGQNQSTTFSAQRTSIREVSFNTKQRCNPPNTSANEGQEEHVFEAIVDVDTIGGGKYKLECQLFFSFESCCRNNATTNIQGSNFYIDCMLDKCLAPGNSGPVFMNTRQIYARYNQSNLYNLMAIDSIDHDVLVYHLEAPQNSKNKYETYKGNYSARYPFSPLCLQAGQMNCSALPLSTPPRGLYHDSMNGNLIYTPINSTEFCAVRYRVNEYRYIQGKKALIGYHTQEYIVLVRQSQPFQAVLSKASMKLTRRVKVGSSIQINFETELKDTLPADSVRIWVSNPIQGSQVTINSKWRSDGSFTWTPSCRDYRPEPYFFIVHFYNEGDSLTRDFQSMAYTIYVDKDLDLGNDTVMCQNKSFQLQSNLIGQYQWNGTSKDSFKTFLAVNEGKYWLDLVRNGCIMSDTIRLTEISNAPLIHLGNDTLICNQANNSPVSLYTTYEKYVKYTWNVDSLNSASTLSFNGSGYVVLKGENVCGSKTDSMLISRMKRPQFILPKDTQICLPFTYRIDVKRGADSFHYFWSNASTDSFTVATAGGYYALKAVNACGEFEDSFFIKASRLPLVELGADTVVCFNQYPLLKVSASESSYYWSTGARDSFIQCRDTGMYYLYLSHYCGNIFDSIHVSSLSKPVVELGRDTIFCKSFQYSLKASSPQANYLWNTGENTDRITVKTPGLYKVTVRNRCAGTEDSILIQQKSAPLVDLGKDTSLNKPFTLVLNAGLSADRYQWNTSAADTFSTLVVNDYGLYSVKAENYCGSVIDFIQVSEKLDLKDQLASRVSIYPNPNQGLLYMDGQISMLSAQVIHLSGKEIMAYTNLDTDDFPLDISKLPDGLYLIRIQTTKGILVYPLSLNR